jgi:flavin-dependent dehydrogenase
MRPETREFDAIVIGAGPAGCGAARLLAASDHRVLLVDRPGTDGHTLAQSIPPSAQKTLAALGALAAIEDAGFHPWRGNTVWWADEPPRVESFPAGASGYQVVRRDFDRRLLDLAIQSGAEVRTGAVRDIAVPALGGESGALDRPSVVIESDGKDVRATAAFVLDCSGRAGVVARRGLRVLDTSHHTVGLAGIWRAAAGWPVPDDTHTLVASYEDGWAWSIPTEPGVRYFTVMVDPARTGLARGKPALEVYRSELGKVRAFAPILERGTLAGGPWGADASLYSARQYAGDGFLLVGDAASFIDPLSSFGVKKALASGWLAAIVVHTALVRPSMRAEALAFFDRRERTIHVAATKQAAEFAGAAAIRTPHPFWMVRAVAPEEHGIDGEPDTAALAADPSVKAAFADLRRRETVRFQHGPDLRIAPRAAVRGREIMLEDHLFLPAWPGGIRYLRDVDLVMLATLATRYSDVGDLCEAMTRAQPQVILPNVLGALSVLIAHGALR